MYRMQQQFWSSHPRTLLHRSLCLETRLDKIMSKCNKKCSHVLITPPWIGVGNGWLEVILDVDEVVVVILGGCVGVSPSNSTQYSVPATTPITQPAPTDGFHCINCASVTPQNAAIDAQVSPCSAGQVNVHALVVTTPAWAAPKRRKSAINDTIEEAIASPGSSTKNMNYQLLSKIINWQGMEGKVEVINIKYYVCTSCGFIL